jgi:hypothetical protein
VVEPLSVSTLAGFATFALWVEAFVCTWKRWRAWKAVAFTLSLPVVWPVFAVTTGGEMTAQTFPDGKPAAAAGGLMFIGGTAIVFAVCAAGWAVASISGWLMRVRSERGRPLGQEHGSATEAC